MRDRYHIVGQLVGEIIIVMASSQFADSADCRNMENVRYGFDVVTVCHESTIFESVSTVDFPNHAVDLTVNHD